MPWYERIYFIVWDLADWFKWLYDKIPDLQWLTDWMRTPLHWIYTKLYEARSNLESFVVWMRELYELIDELGIWKAIWELIKDALPWLADAFEFFADLFEEVKLFFQDPVGRLKYYGEYYILPWMQANIPFVFTLYHWFVDFVDEIELFFKDPRAYLQNAGENVILPWLQEHVPFVIEVYHWFVDFANYINLFFQDPVKFILETIDLDQKLIDWLKEVFPFYDTLVEWFDTLIEFITSPLDFLQERVINWFLGEGEE